MEYTLYRLIRQRSIKGFGKFFQNSRKRTQREAEQGDRPERIQPVTAQKVNRPPGYRRALGGRLQNAHQRIKHDWMVATLVGIPRQ